MANKKGEFAEACNRSACPNDCATYYNQVMGKWYCALCAHDIQEFASRVDKLVLYPKLMHIYPIKEAVKPAPAMNTFPESSASSIR